MAKREILVEQLQPGQAERAFALVQAAMPTLHLEQWVGFVRAFCRQGPEPAAPAHRPQPQGILLAREPAGLILGLTAYSLDHDLHHGRILLGRNFIAFGLLNRRPAAEALAQELETVAAQLGCHAVHLSLAPAADAVCRTSDAWLNALLQERGHRAEEITLCKALPSPPA